MCELLKPPDVYVAEYQPTWRPSTSCTRRNTSGFDDCMENRIPRLVSRVRDERSRTTSCQAAANRVAAYAVWSMLYMTREDSNHMFSPRAFGCGPGSDAVARTARPS